MKKLLLATAVVLMAVPAMAEPTCFNFAGILAMGRQDVAVSYATHIIRQLDEPNVSRGCTALNPQPDQLINMIMRMCRANSSETVEYPIYNAVADTYQIYRGMANKFGGSCR